LRALRARHSLALALLACASVGIPKAEIPADSIAFNYRTPEEARRRADAYQKEQDDQIDAARKQVLGVEGVPASGELHSSADHLASYVAQVLGRTPQQEELSPGRLALLDPRTGQVTVLEAARRGSVPLEWSGDRTRLLFAQPGERDFQVYEYDRERGTVRPITHGPPAYTEACYASQGRVVVTAVDANSATPRSRIEISRPGGGGPFEPLTDWGTEYSPSCAPDGHSVVWVRDKPDGRSELRLLVLEPGAQIVSLAPGRQPRFSADGAWIVYSSAQGKDFRIWRVRPDGSSRARIGSSERSEARPTLSPDGRFVAYVASEAPPRRYLYLRRFDGSGDQILFADGDGENPVW
jgi:Tol biopolymer transport system component